jgi:hypothetical protein
MPTINIPPVVRFVLYLVGAMSLLTVSYAVDKSWAGDAEVRYVTGLAALLQLLAAAKTNIRDEPKVIKDGAVKVASTDETGNADALVVLAVAILIGVVLILFGVRLG